MWVFLAVEIVLLGISMFGGPVAGPTAGYLLRAVAAVVFTVSIARRRPRPLVGWALLAAALWALTVTVVTLGAVYGLREGAAIAPFVPSLVAILTYPLVAAALIILCRAAPRAGPAGVLDTGMTALAAFLLLWAFVIAPRIDSDPLVVVGAAVAVLGVVLVLTLAVRLGLAGGMREPATRLVVLAVVALVVATFLVLLPALASDPLRSNWMNRLFYCLFAIGLGVAGLHPALERRHYPVPSRAGASPGRLILFAVLAVVPATVWGMELSRKIRRPDDVLSFVVPVVVAAVFLLFLVARLGLLAQVAQESATELARRSAALAEAASEQEDLQRQLTHRAMHDPLTGLSNRLVLSERMERALSRRTGAGQHSLLLLDLDGFKDVNDTLGHPVGDELLIEVSRRLMEAAPPDATLARLGGDEFAVFIEDAVPGVSVSTAERFVTALRQTYRISGRELFLTTSVGVLTIGPTDPPGTAAVAVAAGSRVPNPTPAEALRDADLALYAAKAEGKNRVVVFHPDLRSARLDHTRISAGIRHALSHDEFLLHYQPIVDLETLDIVAVEALIRWEQPGQPLIEPADFVSIAEDTGLILPLGGWVLRQACRDVRDWYHQHHVAVAVNVSGRQLDSPAFVEEVLEALAEAGLPGRALIIEITESNLVATSHTDALYSHLQRLRARGVRVAIDDFGTGYSSLSYVAKLPVDIVKIDKAFTHPSDSTGVLAHDWAFTRAILQMVESLHLLAVAEGVETPQQVEALRALRCPLVQGFQFYRPVAKLVMDRTLETGGVTQSQPAMPPMPGAGPVPQNS